VATAEVTDELKVANICERGALFEHLGAMLADTSSILTSTVIATAVATVTSSLAQMVNARTECVAREKLASDERLARERMAADERLPRRKEHQRRCLEVAALRELLRRGPLAFRSRTAHFPLRLSDARIAARRATFTGGMLVQGRGRPCIDASRGDSER
jgi:hypothetical protein